jgi:uncharacterized protein
MSAPLRAVLRAVALVLLACVLPAAARAETPIPPAPAAWVTDTAGVLSPDTVDGLNARLRAYERATGHQILVYIAPTTGGDPIDDWAVNAFAKWKVGRQGLDDGLVLFVFTRDRTDRIEVGYGLEATVPDIAAGEILRQTLEPGLAAGQPDQAVTGAVGRILALVGGESAGASGQDNGGDASGVPLSPIDLVALGLLLLVFLVVAVRSPWLAMLLLVNIFSGGRGGGFGGGGFAGGGGRSGGGGASGRW